MDGNDTSLSISFNLSRKKFFQEKFNSIIRIRENRGKLRSISFHLDFSKRNEMIFRNSRELTSNLACFELLQERCEEKERGKKKINACDQLFVFTLRTDRFSVPLSIVGLIISPLFTRNYSLLAKRIENQFLQCSLNCAPIDRQNAFLPISFG